VQIADRTCDIDGFVVVRACGGEVAEVLRRGAQVAEQIGDDVDIVRSSCAVELFLEHHLRLGVLTAAPHEKRKTGARPDVDDVRALTPGDLGRALVGRSCAVRVALQSPQRAELDEGLGGKDTVRDRSQTTLERFTTFRPVPADVPERCERDREAQLLVPGRRFARPRDRRAHVVVRSVDLGEPPRLIRPTEPGPRFLGDAKMPLEVAIADGGGVRGDRELLPREPPDRLQ
jgi:hypothetical protein